MTWRREDGAEAVEFALILPLLLIILGGVIDIGYVAILRAQMTEAAEEAVIVLSRSPSAADVRARVADGVSAANLTAANVKVTCPSASKVAVRIDHDHDLLTPFLSPFLGDSVTITSVIEGSLLAPGPCVKDPL
jgi:Flp pilus assembly protein TadG